MQKNIIFFVSVKERFNNVIRVKMTHNTYYFSLLFKSFANSSIINVLVVSSVTIASNRDVCVDIFIHWVSADQIFPLDK